MRSTEPRSAKGLLAAAMEYCASEGVHTTALPGFKVIRRDHTTEASPVMYDSIVCIVLQGEKQVWTGKRVYRYNPQNYLVSSVDVPATAQVVRASRTEPYIGLTLELQPSVVYEILREIPALEQTNAEPDGGFFVEKVTPGLTDAFARLMDALKHENDLKVLAPSIVREIHYRLMSSRYGARVRQLGVVGSKTQRISKVIEHLKRTYTASLKIAELAALANMSPSSFHLHFRQVTGMSPLQYQKQLRLQEARRLLSTETLDAASVAFQVGYESPSQFSREYRRLFGQPPRRDIDRARLAMIA